MATLEALHPAAIDRGTSDRAAVEITTLQCGMGWFPEQEGGLNRVYYNLSQSLPTVGVGVRGLVTGERGDPAVGIHAFAPPTASLALRWWHARRTTRGLLDGIDVVASHFALYTVPLLGALGERPLVVHFHGPWATEAAVERPSAARYRARRTVEQAVYRRADRFIVLSDAFADVLATTYGVPTDRIRVVPGGAEVARFNVALSQADARRQLGWDPDRPIVLAVRRLARRMGLDVLIDALALVHQRVPDALLFIAGRGPIAGELQEQIDANGLADHVRLLGFVPDDDLPLAYRAATLSVVPTQVLEGFGLITAESLAAGTPVLVTPIGGLPETVRGLSPTLILDGADASSIARGLAAALDGTAVLPSAQACRDYARARYDWSAVARQVREVYYEVLP